MSIIEVKNLSKKFGDFIAVNDVSFNVEKGEIFAFLGPNGAGKTTTIKMLTTLLEPTGGEVKVNGFNLNDQRDDVRRSFGIVFQDPSLDDELTAYENMEFHAILYGHDKVDRTKRIEELMKLVDLWDRKKDLVKNFSGGMKRRLEIARSLIHTPKIIFLDEPTVGLDPQTRNHIWSYVVNLSKKEGVTVFLTTHYMEEADKMADRVVVIDHGKIIGSGTPAELKANTGTNSLEEAFLKLTGDAIRSDEASSLDNLRTAAKNVGEKKIRIIYKNMNTIYILWLRQLKKYSRSTPRIIGSLGQPLLFLLVFGFGFGSIFQKAGEGNYIQFLVPGIVAMAVVFSAIFSGIELIWDRQFGFLKETMVAPVSRFNIMLGRALGGASVAVIQGIAVLIISFLVGFKISNFLMIFPAFIFMFLTALLFTSLGTAIASKLQDMQAFPIIMNFLVMPLFFLSGSIFPLDTAPKALQVLGKLDPLSYGIDGLRYAFIGVSAFSPWTDFFVLVGVCLVILFIGKHLFEKMEA